MSAVVMDGKRLAAECEPGLSERVAALAERGRIPALATILVGDDPASATYVRMKGNACRRIGLRSVSLALSSDTSTEQLIERIEALNADPDIAGILLQHPVPAQIDERACFDAIALDKDVDGVTCLGFGRMSMGRPAWGAATPAGIMRLLARYDIDPTGMRAVVVGRSPILGKPLAQMLLNANATVTVCHSRSRRLAEIVRSAELLVGAVGRARLIRAEWIADGAVVVDAGYHPDGVGDVELAAAIPRLAAYTPVPGGVGPMTINTLIAQTVAAAERSA